MVEYVISYTSHHLHKHLTYEQSSHIMGNKNRYPNGLEMCRGLLYP
jgi:hypothetical protein